MAASNNQTFIVNASLQQVNALMCDAAFIQGTELTFAAHIPTPNQITFRFTTGVSFTSWGEIVNITIAAIGNNQVQMSIDSECAMPTQIIDYGKNRRNVERVANYVNQNIGRYTMTPPSAAPAQRFCQQCGAQLTPNSQFCTKCGKKL